MTLPLYDATVTKMSNQLATRAMDPGLYGSQWTIQNITYFGVAHFLFVKQQKGVTIFFSQRINR